MQIAAQKAQHKHGLSCGQAFFATVATLARDLDAAHADNLAAAEKVGSAAALLVHSDLPGPCSTSHHHVIILSALCLL